MLAIRKDSNDVVIVKSRKPTLESTDIEVSKELFKLIIPPCKYTGDEENGYTVTRVAYENKPVDTFGTAPDIARSSKLNELSAAAQAIIIAGCDVTLSDGTTGHISMTAEDQINLTTAQAAVQGGATGYPYHLDGHLCKIYPAEDILTMAKTAVAHILYHTTYCNHLRAWAQRATTADELTAITYGATLPDDLAQHMSTIIGDA